MGVTMNKRKIHHSEMSLNKDLLFKDKLEIIL